MSGNEEWDRGTGSNYRTCQQLTGNCVAQKTLALAQILFNCPFMGRKKFALKGKEGFPSLVRRKECCRATISNCRGQLRWQLEPRMSLLSSDMTARCPRYVKTASTKPTLFIITALMKSGNKTVSVGLLVRFLSIVLLNYVQSVLSDDPVTCLRSAFNN